MAKATRELETHTRLTTPEQQQVRQTSLNELGLALARIEGGVQQIMRQNASILHEIDHVDGGLSAKLDTLSGQLQPLAGLSVQLTNVATAIRAEIVTDHEAVLRRIDKLGNDLFAALAVLKLRKNKHKRKKGKK